MDKQEIHSADVRKDRDEVQRRRRSPFANMITVIRAYQRVAREAGDSSEMRRLLSENKLRDELLVMQVDLLRESDASLIPNIPSPTHFTRMMNNEELFDTRLVGLAGKRFSLYLKLDPEIGGESFTAEHQLWVDSLQRPAALPDSPEVKAPVVRRKLFRETVRTVLYGQKKKGDKNVITIIADPQEDAARYKDQVGRGQYAMSVCQYCCYDAPESVRRVLHVASLAGLNAETQETAREVNVVRIAGRICAELGLPRGSGADLPERVTLYLRHQVRPLLLLRDTDGVPPSVLADFVKTLVASMPDESDFIVLVVSQGALLGADKEGQEYVVPLKPFTQNDMVEYIAWRAVLDITDPRLKDLHKLCGQLPNHLRSPLVASVLAGAYLLDIFGDGPPWLSFGRDRDPDNQNIPIAEASMQGIIDTVTRILDAARGDRAIGKLGDVSEILSVLLARHYKPEENGEHSNGFLTEEELQLLMHLAVFEGRFSKDAARGCYMDFSGRPQPDDKEAISAHRHFDQLLDRLCLLGVIVVEKVSSPPSFYMVGEMRSYLLGPSLASETLPIISKAKKNYLAYLWTCIKDILENFNRDFHQVDTGDSEHFGRLERESAHIDNFLISIWKQAETDGTMELPVPQVNRDEVRGLFNGEKDGSESEDKLLVRVRQVLWLGAFVTNLALFWLPASLAASAVYHLNEADKLIEKVVGQLKTVSASNQSWYFHEARRQLLAVQAQALLSYVDSEMRQRRLGHATDEWTDRLTRAKANSEDVGYRYGLALAALNEAIIANRKDPTDEFKLFREAAKIGLECAGTVPSSPGEAEGDDLLMMRQRRPVARNLAFKAELEEARALRRAWKLPEAIATNQALVRASMMTRQPGLISEALVSLVYSYWFASALSSDKPFTDEHLTRVRNALFQVDAYIPELRAERNTLLMYRQVFFGLYGIEKGLSDRARRLGMEDGVEDHINERRWYSEEMLATSLPLILESQARGVLSLLVADSYSRFAQIYDGPIDVGETHGYVEGDRESTTKYPTSRKQEKTMGRARSSALAAAFIARALADLEPEVCESYTLSRVVQGVLHRVHGRLGMEKIQGGIMIHSGANGKDIRYAEKLLRFYKGLIKE